MYKKIIKISILFFALLFFTNSVFAVNLEIKTENSDIKKDDVYTVSIIMDTKSESINTVEGDLVYDQDGMEVLFINTSASFVNLWVEKPAISNKGTIHFSGMTPGGVSMPKGNIFDVVFRAKNVGSFDLSLNNSILYLNDGLGTKTKDNIKNLNIQINEGKGVNSNFDLFKNDNVKPEKFSIERSKDDSMYNGNYFIVFNPIDKNSGISYVKVCELFKCKKIESPAPLSNQTDFYFIRVTAFDMNGNSTSAFLVSNLFYVSIFSVFIFASGLFLSFKSKKL